MRLLTLLVCFVALSTAEARTKRILVVGDSWASGMTHPLTGRVFQKTLDSNDFKHIGVVATAHTAMPGSHAAHWATNHEQKLDNLKKTLEANPTIDVVFLVTGGADFLAQAVQKDLSKLSDKERGQIWKSIGTNIQTLVDFTLAVRTNMQVVICDYDYLNNERTAKSFLKWGYHNISQERFNQYFVELGREKLALAQRTARCHYVQNWGVLQNACAKKDEPKPPLPGGPPTYDPYPGGDITKAGPAQGFSHLGINDGIHPNSHGYRLLIENALRQVLGDLLKPGEQ